MSPASDESTPTAKNSPVTLRLGDLELEVQTRRREGESLATVVRRDLERYYRLLRDAQRREFAFSPEQAITLAILAGTGDLVFDASSYRYLWAEVESQLEAWAAEECSPLPAGLDGPLLVQKLKRLSPAGVMTLIDTLELYTERVPAGAKYTGSDELLIAGGLVARSALEAYRDAELRRTRPTRPDPTAAPIPDSAEPPEPWEDGI